MSVSDYARTKKISNPSVYNAINSGKIIPVLIGANKDIYIDLSTYGDLQFKVHPTGKYPRSKSEKQ